MKTIMDKIIAEKQRLGLPATFTNFEMMAAQEAEKELIREIEGLDMLEHDQEDPYGGIMLEDDAWQSLKKRHGVRE